MCVYACTCASGFSGCFFWGGGELKAFPVGVKGIWRACLLVYREFRGDFVFFREFGKFSCWSSGDLVFLPAGLREFGVFSCTRALFALCTLSVLIWSSLFSALLSLAASVLLLFLSLFSGLLTVSAFFLLSSRSVPLFFVWLLFAFVLPLHLLAVWGLRLPEVTCLLWFSVIHVQADASSTAMDTPAGRDYDRRVCDRLRFAACCFFFPGLVFVACLLSWSFSCCSSFFLLLSFSFSLFLSLSLFLSFPLFLSLSLASSASVQHQHRVKRQPSRKNLWRQHVGKGNVYSIIVG